MEQPESNTIKNFQAKGLTAKLICENASNFFRYMKYLYPYECEKEKLSTPEELQAAIDGNRREGRRSSYGNYDSVQRSPSTSHLNPLSIVTQQQQQIARIMNAGVSLPNGTPQSSHHHSPLMSSVNGGVLPGFPSTPEMEARMLEYIKAMAKSNDHMLRSQQTPSGSVTPPTTIPSLSAFADISRMNFWNLYSTNNNNHHHHPEPQKEALNLSEPATSQATNGKRENEHPTPSPPPKRVPTSNSNQEEREPANGIGHRPAMTSIKIDSRGGSGGDDSLVVNMELNGITYQGVLFAQGPTSRGRTPHSQ